jgi:hypothetical protein
MVNDVNYIGAILRKRLRFLLPMPVAIAVMLGLGIMGSDFAATHSLAGLIQVGVYEAALGFNILLRWRTLARIERLEGRLLAGRCVSCGYDLRATPDRCPECGAMPNTL